MTTAQLNTGSEIGWDYALLERKLWDSGYKPVRLVKISLNPDYETTVFGLEVYCDDVPTWEKLRQFLYDNKSSDGTRLSEFFYASYPSNQRSQFLRTALNSDDSDKD